MDISAALCSQPEFEPEMFTSAITRPAATKSLFQNLGDSNPEPSFVSLDHCYAKPWNAHPDSFRAHPAKMLFMRGIVFNSKVDNVNCDEEIDVVEAVSQLTPLYDMVKAGAAMRECERYAKSNCTTQISEDWEENIPRQGWTATKKRLFGKIAKIINSECLARLVYKSHPNEPVLRRLALDKTAARVRHLFASILWDIPTLQWLHVLLTEHLPHIPLAVYLDVLQTLKTKLPTLVEKILQGSKNNDTFLQLLRKPWDPVAATLNHNKLKKLSGSPLIVWTPGDPAYSCVGQSKRMKLWHTQLSALGKLVTVNPQVNQGVTIAESLDAIITAVRYEVMELKLNFPTRPIILVGWTIGALIACQVALLEAVTAIVCLGFPLTGVNGSRGDLDDPLLESLTPTLFVVGQKATMCSVDDIEDFRERMRAESGLVVIGGADDHLRVCSFKKKLDGISQVMVDRCILEEMSEFLSHVLSHPQSLASVPSEPVDRRKRRIDKDPDFEPKKPSRSQSNSLPASTVPSRTVSPSSPASSSTETSSSGSSLNDSSAERSSISRQQLKRSRSPLLVPATGFIDPNPNGKRIRLSSDQLTGGAQFFSQQLGLPVMTPTSSTAYQSPNRPGPKPRESGSPPSTGLGVGGISTLSSFRQVASSIPRVPPSAQIRGSIPKPSDIPGSSTDSFKSMKNIMIPPLSFKQGLTSKATRQSNTSYLTVANPMLSSILDGKTTQSLFSSSKTSGTATPEILSPKRPAVGESLKTYMRSPNQSLVSRTIIKPLPPTNILAATLTQPKTSIQLSSADKAYLMAGNASAQNPSVLQTTLQAPLPGSPRKMQVITFMKPPNNPAKKEKLVSFVPRLKQVLSVKPTQLVKIVEPSTTAFTAITRVKLPSACPSLGAITSAVEEHRVSQQLAVNEPTVLDEPVVLEEPIMEPPKQKLDEPALIQSISSSGDLTAFTCALTSAMAQPFITSNEILEEPVINVEEEEETTEPTESITDRLSHLSAGTQEAILALTQLSNFSEDT